MIQDQKHDSFYHVFVQALISIHVHVRLRTTVQYDMMQLIHFVDVPSKFLPAKLKLIFVQLCNVGEVSLIVDQLIELETIKIKTPELDGLIKHKLVFFCANY